MQALKAAKFLQTSAPSSDQKKQRVALVLRIARAILLHSLPATIMRPDRRGLAKRFNRKTSQTKSHRPQRSSLGPIYQRVVVDSDETFF